MARNIERSMSNVVEYRRGQESLELLAAIGRSVYEVDDGNGAIVRVHARDFIVRTDALVLGGAVSTPRRGDRVIERTSEGQEIAHEVTSISGQPEWDYSDQARRTMRIHTKQATA
jgi:hypothetical protein